MFKKLLILCLSLIFVFPTFAQDDSTKTFTSDDGAVQFQYFGDWQLETHSYDYKELYFYQLWSPPRNPMTLYLGSNEHSRIVIQVANADVYPDVSAPINVAEFSLPQAEFEPIESDFDNESQYLASFEMENHDDLKGIFYVDLVDDAWVITASLISPLEAYDASAEDFLNILSVLSFDAAAAAVPFERDLEDYDYGDVDLTQSHTNESGLLSVDYPTDWELTSSEPYGSSPPIAYDIYFDVPDESVQVKISTLDTTTDRLGLPLNQNTPYEYMYDVRNSPENVVTEYRVGEYDAARLLYEDKNVVQIVFALNDIWVASGLIRSDSLELSMEYEAELVAVLASLEFGLQQSYISAPLFYVDFSDEWVYAVNNQDDASYAQYILRPTGPLNPSGPRIVIEFIYIESRDNVILEDIPGLIGVEAIDSEWLIIGDNEIYRFASRQAETPRFGRWSAFYVGEEWLMLVESFADTETQFEATLDVADSIIENIEFTLDAE